MTFPDTPLDLRAELQVNGAWVSVADRLDHGPVVIGRGHPDESTTMSPSTLAMTLTNTDAALSPDNPSSPWWPWITQNTPCRISVPAQVNYLRLETDQLSYFTCPDSAALHITGDIDIRIDVLLTDWQSSVLAAKWVSGAGAGGQNCWLLALNGDGTLQLFWSTDGSNFPSGQSTVPLPYTSGRFAIRATLAVATGTVTFYTGPAGNADSNSGWTQLGAAVVTGATSIFAGTTAVTAGGSISGTASMNGNVYEFEVRQGIAGTVRAHPVFSAQAAGATSFADAQANTWSASGTAEISSRSYRGHFEVPEWPQHEPPYHPAGENPEVTVAVSGGGLLRRYGQRNNPVDSALKRGYIRLTGSQVPVAYWPCEDATAATQIASAIGGPAMLVSGKPSFAADSGFLCSNPIPTVESSVWKGTVPSYANPATPANMVQFLLDVPSAGTVNGAVLARMMTTGTIARLDVTYGTGGTLALTGFDPAGTQLFTTGAVAFGVNGAPCRISMALAKNGTGTDYHLDSQVVGAGQGGASGTQASATVGIVREVIINPNGAALSGVGAGHVSVQSFYSAVANLAGQLNAWAGEAAGNRFARLCSEEGVQFRSRGALAATALMGPQSPQTIAELLQECADADRGVWYEPRQCLGWGYITQAALCNQAARLTLDYAQDHLSEWPADPTRDDQVIVNDATVSQSASGSSARQFAAPGQPITGGRLSTLAPASGGAGTYDQSYSLNLYAAADLDSEASWIVHVGTVDQARFPGIGIDLSNRALSPLFYTVLDTDLGDRLVISNPPPHLGPNPLSQLAQQLTETLGGFDLLVTVTGVPEVPYEVAVSDDAVYGRADTDGSSLAVAAGSAATSLTVATGQGFPVWTQNAADCPFDIAAGGERITVTAVAAAGNALFGDNATFDAGTGHWSGNGGAFGSLARVTSPVRSGPGALQVTANGTGGTFAVKGGFLADFATTGITVPCNPGDLVFAGVFARAATTVRTIQCGVLWFDVNGNGVGSGNLNGGTADSLSAFVQTSGQFTAPAGAAWAMIQAQVVSAAANESHVLDDALLLNQTSPNPQVFTVTRAVNGIAKAQAAGTDVRLWFPPIAALN